jgi:hypothetical protein
VRQPDILFFFIPQDQIMPIRPYQPGDEEAQAEIYNRAAGALPGFKPTTAEEIARRYRTSDPDPTTKFYAVEDGRVVGYAVLNANARISYPWCLPGAEDRRGPLLEAVLADLSRRGYREAWTAYRDDWGPVLDFFERLGFVRRRAMINYLAELDRLPRRGVPEGQAIARVMSTDLRRALALGRGLVQEEVPEALEGFYLGNAYFDPSCLYILETSRGVAPLGLALAIADASYAHPTKLDAAMPCFRLGAMGTETERHKRVNGMVSCLFATEADGEVLLAEAARRFEAAGLTHAAAQAPSDRPDLCAFYDRFFRRQGSFPLLSKRLAATPA